MMLNLPQPLMLVLLLSAGMALDWLLGEVRRWHPLVGFGRLASLVEGYLNRGRMKRIKGICAWMLVVLPPVILANALIGIAYKFDPWLAAGVHVLLLYFSLGLRSLRDHMLPIADTLAAGDLTQARQLTSRIVSRDTAHADATDIAKAAVESTLENGNDAVFGTLFWFLIGGGLGALLFRLANTLDAMWGYRNERFLDFGWMAARSDDALNWIPARLTALSYLLLGQHRTAWYCWRTQSQAWPSPNAGPVMSAGAGALGLALGGGAMYDGIVEQRPPLGMGRVAVATDIHRAWLLVMRTCLLWIVVATAMACILAGSAHA